MGVRETMIWIKKETRDMLKKVGRKDETYDDVIRRILTEAGYDLKKLVGHSDEDSVLVISDET